MKLLTDGFYRLIVPEAQATCNWQFSRASFAVYANEVMTAITVTMKFAEACCESCCVILLQFFKAWEDDFVMSSEEIKVDRWRSAQINIWWCIMLGLNKLHNRSWLSRHQIYQDNLRVLDWVWMRKKEQNEKAMRRNGNTDLLLRRLSFL